MRIPPPPVSAPTSAAQLLRDHAAALDVEEILDLCYAFPAEPVRLRVYLESLRQKGSPKAHAAASLLCFDLARRGDAQAERDFQALIPVVEPFVRPALPGALRMELLVEGNEFLISLWEDLKRHLQHRDPRVEFEGSSPFETPPAVEIELLDDEDIAEIDLDDVETFSASQEAVLFEWERAFDRFLFDKTAASADSNPAEPDPVDDTPFSAATRASIGRTKRFREDATSFEALVPEAKEMLPCIELFLAAHLRAKNLFGRANPERDRFLAAGLAHFTSLEFPPVTAFMWLQDPTGAPYAFDKVTEILLDYICHLSQTSIPGASPADLANSYVHANREQPPPPRMSPKGERRRR